MVRAAFIFLVWTLVVCSARAQSIAPTSKLRVALYGSAPFVIPQDGGVFTGLSVDIWQEVAAKNGWGFTYTVYPTIEAAIEALRSGKADLLVGDIGIVSSLFDKVEFSQPYFHSGLQIMVSGARPRTLGKFLQDIAAWGHLSVIYYLAAGLAVLTVLVTLFERKHNPDFPKTWRDGVAESFYYVASLSLGKSAYKGFAGWFGRLVMVIWMLASVFLVAYVTSVITSEMTVEKLQTGILNKDDLPGHQIGVLKDSPAIDYLKKHDIAMRVYPDLDAAVNGLVQGEIPAIVDSAPTLEYYDNNHPQINITEVGSPFSRYNYGFAMPIGSVHRMDLNSALVELQEDNVLAELGQHYFGPVYEP